MVEQLVFVGAYQGESVTVDFLFYFVRLYFFSVHTVKTSSSTSRFPSLFLWIFFAEKKY